MLDDLGLVPAIRWYLDRQAQRGGFVGRLVADKIEGHYSSMLEIVIFRVIQEGLTNIVRHAHARNVNVELTKQDGQLNLRLRDDGDGFDLSAIEKDTRPGRNLGLIGMEERVLLLGGQFQINSTPGQGTELYACIPLESVTEKQSEKLGTDWVI
jgi:signal transduction histidine kinase